MKRRDIYANLRKGERFIQILKHDIYYIGLTNKGRIIQLDIYEDRPGEGREGAVFLLSELKFKS